MIRCGKGHQHGTIAEVRACYGVAEAKAAVVRPVEPTFDFETSDRIWDVEMQRQEREEDIRVAEYKMARARDAAARPIPMGTFTVPKADGTHRTIQIGVAEWTKDDKAIVASYLAGPDNELSYKAFAFVKPGGKYNLFKKFRADSQLARDLHFLLNEAVIADAHEAFLQEAEKYALRSSRCMRCMHKLTVPASLHRGLGPVCAGIEGIA